MGATVKEYRGPDVVVRYDVKRCIHARECVRGLPEVFDPQARPWINPAAASAQRLAAVVHRCPTGALHLDDADGRSSEALPTINTATVTPDGPLYLRGDIEIVDGDGNLILQDTRVALCRCGASANKPFCDNSHRRIGFTDGGRFAGEMKIDAAQATGKLRVIVKRNSSLKIQGALSLARSDGVVVQSDVECWLCRCGQSANKPYCDGTHKKVGFVG